jgi:hypothetical protein
VSVDGFLVQDHVHEDDDKVVFHILVRKLLAMLLERERRSIG